MTEKVTEKAPDMEIMAKYHLEDERVRHEISGSPPNMLPIRVNVCCNIDIWHQHFAVRHTRG